LQDYRTAEQKLSFPKEINRYGKASNYTAEQLRQTADNIITAFENLKTDSGQAKYDNVMSKISRLCVTIAANTTPGTPGYNYTWDGSIFGVHVTSNTSIIQARLNQIYDNELPTANPAPGLL